LPREEKGRTGGSLHAVAGFREVSKETGPAEREDEDVEPKLARGPFPLAYGIGTSAGRFRGNDQEA